MCLVYRELALFADSNDYALLGHGQAMGLHRGSAFNWRLRKI